MDTLAARRKTFDEVAELYDRYRPGYPAALVEDVVAQSGIPPAGRILEIGCGTGKATRPFAERGYRITALEPGPNLARLAEANLAAFPDVRIARTTFEDWPPEPAGFDLVMAAQSFHFIDAPSGLARAADALAPHGAIAIFAHQPQRGDSALQQRLENVYARLEPALRPRDEESGLEGEIDRTRRFAPVTVVRYPWRRVFTADEYVGLQQTQSNHRLLPPARRAALLEAIRQTIEAHGGALEVDYVTLLLVARLRPAA
jgi:SAM-dependent methyltransferase